MSKKSDIPDEEISSDIDWSKAVRGRHAARLKGTVPVTLRGDLAKAYDSSEEILEALKAAADGFQRGAGKQRQFLKKVAERLTTAENLVKVFCIKQELVAGYSQSEIKEALREYAQVRARQRNTA
jgi:hypothetical protein